MISGTKREPEFFFKTGLRRWRKVLDGGCAASHFPFAAKVPGARRNHRSVRISGQPASGRLSSYRQPAWFAFSSTYPRRSCLGYGRDGPLHRPALELLSPRSRAPPLLGADDPHHDRFSHLLPIMDRGRQSNETGPSIAAQKNVIPRRSRRIRGVLPPPQNICFAGKKVKPLIDTSHPLPNRRYTSPPRHVGYGKAEKAKPSRTCIRRRIGAGQIQGEEA